MSEMSFGAGAEARGRIGNVFLAFAEVKRTSLEFRLIRSLLFPFADLACHA
jgi:hypothetical protein